MNEKFVSPSIETIPGDAPEDKSVSFGAYKRDGEVFVYADSYEASKLTTFTIKQAAYEYRLGIGMSHSGISQFGSPYVVGPEDPKTGLEKRASAGKFVWRQLYKLTPML
jgi:hypothetical protein